MPSVRLIPGPRPLDIKGVRSWLGRATPYTAPIVARAALSFAFFVTAPMITRRFGLGGLGLWTLYTTASQAPLVLDVGLIDCLMREAGLAVSGNGSWSRTRRVLLATLSVYVIYAAVVAAAAFFATDLVMTTFNVPSSLQPDAERLMKLLPVAMLVSGLASISQTLHLVAAGATRYYGAATFVAVVGGLACVTALLVPGRTLARLAIVGVVAQAALPLLLLRLRLFGDVLLTRHRPDGGKLREVMSYGIKVAVANITSFVMNYTDRFFLAAYTDLRVVAGYEVGTRALGVARSMATAVLPTQFARFVRQPTGALYRSIESRFALLSVFSVVGVLTITPFFVRLWLGQDLPPYALESALVVATTSLVILSTGVPVIVARAVGRPNPELISVLVNLVLNLGLTIHLGPRVGFAGVMAATVAGTVLGASVFHVLWRREPQLGGTYPGVLTTWSVVAVASGLPLGAGLAIAAVFDLSDISLAGVFGGAWLLGLVAADWRLTRQHTGNRLVEAPA